MLGYLLPTPCGLALTTVGSIRFTGQNVCGYRDQWDGKSSSAPVEGDTVDEEGLRTTVKELVAASTPSDWRYVAEGALNIVVRYNGSEPLLSDVALRCRKLNPEADPTPPQAPHPSRHSTGSLTRHTGSVGGGPGIHRHHHHPTLRTSLRPTEHGGGGGPALAERARRPDLAYTTRAQASFCAFLFSVLMVGLCGLNVPLGWGSIITIPGNLILFLTWTLTLAAVPLVCDRHTRRVERMTIFVVVGAGSGMGTESAQTWIPCS